MVKLKADKEFSTQVVNPIVKNAIITANGKLTPNYEYIANLREKQK